MAEEEYQILARLPDTYFLAEDFIIKNGDDKKETEPTVCIKYLVIDTPSLRAWKHFREESSKPASAIDHPQSFLEYLRKNRSETSLDNDAIAEVRRLNKEDFPGDPFVHLIRHDLHRSKFLGGLNLKHWNMCVNHGGVLKRSFEKYFLEDDTKGKTIAESSTEQTEKEKFLEELELWEFAVRVYLQWFNERGRKHLTLITGEQVSRLNDVLLHFGLPKVRTTGSLKFEYSKTYRGETAKSAPRKTLSDYRPTPPEKKRFELYRKRHGIVSKSKVMLEVFDKIENYAPSKSTVLITGETGTGKELVAKAIHKQSNRRHKDLVTVLCSDIPRETLKDELFGHKKGAFTGADTDSKGYFGEADEGTIFLDEIGDTSLEVQASILRVIEYGQYLRGGDPKAKHTDVRVIAATNRNLEKEIQEKKFREELFYRLNVAQIVLPPLRNRLEDIPLLCDYFLRDLRAEMIDEKDKVITFEIDSDIAEPLMTRDWRGNIRELRNFINKIYLDNREYLSEMTPGMLKRIFQDPKLDMKQLLDDLTQGDDPIRHSKYWKAISTYIQAGYSKNKAANELRLYWDTASKRINSGFLQLGSSLGFEDQRSAEYLDSFGLPTSGKNEDNFLSAIRECYTAIIRSYLKPTSKKHYENEDLEQGIVALLIEKRPELVDEVENPTGKRYTYP